MKQVSIRINKGKVTADFIGFQGQTCQFLADKIQPEGVTENEKIVKPEYNTPQEQTETA